MKDVFPKKLPSLADYPNDLGKEELDVYFEDLKLAGEENSKRCKRGTWRVMLCAMLKTLEIDQASRNTHYKWCPYEAWMNYDPISELRASLKAGVPKLKK